MSWAAELLMSSWPAWVYLRDDRSRPNKLARSKRCAAIFRFYGDWWRWHARGGANFQLQKTFNKPSCSRGCIIFTSPSWTFSYTDLEQQWEWCWAESDRFSLFLFCPANLCRAQLLKKPFHFRRLWALIKVYPVFATLTLSAIWSLGFQLASAMSQIITQATINFREALKKRGDNVLVSAGHSCFEQVSNWVCKGAWYVCSEQGSSHGHGFMLCGQVTPTALLHTVAALYVRSLPELDESDIYQTLCETSTRTIVLVRRVSGKCIVIWKAAARCTC